MREEVKDLLDRAVGWYSPPPIRAEDVRARGERRRRSGRVVAAAVALVVFAAAGALTWTAFRPQRTGVGEEPVVQDVSATVLGVSVTYPEDWTLVDLWPLARSIASWPDPIGTSINVPEGTNERGGLPVLQLSNVDLGLRSVCGVDATANEAVLYVAVNGGPYLVAEDGTARWRGILTQDDGPCGPGWYAYRHSTEDNGDGTTSERPYLVFARFGRDASAQDRRIVFDAYDSLSFAPADILHPPTEESPRYVERLADGPAPEQTDIGLGFPVCDVSSVDGAFGTGSGTAYVATRVGDMGGCPTDEGGSQILAVDASGDGLADGSFEPLDCQPACRMFADTVRAIHRRLRLDPEASLRLPRLRPALLVGAAGRPCRGCLLFV
jgi:hypothetical protein